MKHQLSEQVIREALPVPPFSYKYEITQQSPQIWRVDLIHPMKYSYTAEQIKTIWGFIKTNGKVYPPSNSKKPKATPVCEMDEIPDELYYTTIIPKCRSLMHIK